MLYLGDNNMMVTRANTAQLAGESCFNSGFVEVYEDKGSLLGKGSIGKDGRWNVLFKTPCKRDAIVIARALSETGDLRASVEAISPLSSALRPPCIRYYSAHEAGGYTMPNKEVSFKADGMQPTTITSDSNGNWHIDNLTLKEDALIVCATLGEGVEDGQESSQEVNVQLGNGRPNPPYIDVSYSNFFGHTLNGTGPAEQKIYAYLNTGAFLGSTQIEPDGTWNMSTGGITIPMYATVFAFVEQTTSTSGSNIVMGTCSDYGIAYNGKEAVLPIPTMDVFTGSRFSGTVDLSTYQLGSGYSLSVQVAEVNGSGIMPYAPVDEHGKWKMIPDYTVPNGTLVHARTRLLDPGSSEVDDSFFSSVKTVDNVIPDPPKVEKHLVSVVSGTQTIPQGFSKANGNSLTVKIGYPVASNPTDVPATSIGEDSEVLKNAGAWSIPGTYTGGESLVAWTVTEAGGTSTVTPFKIDIENIPSPPSITVLNHTNIEGTALSTDLLIELSTANGNNFDGNVFNSGRTAVENEGVSFIGWSLSMPKDAKAGDPIYARLTNTDTDGKSGIVFDSYQEDRPNPPDKVTATTTMVKGDAGGADVGNDIYIYSPNGYAMNNGDPIAVADDGSWQYTYGANDQKLDVGNSVQVFQVAGLSNRWSQQTMARLRS